jgi:hypothetical protein
MQETTTIYQPWCFSSPLEQWKLNLLEFGREKNNNSSNFFPRLRRRRLMMMTMMISKNREETFPFSLLFFLLSLSLSVVVAFVFSAS